MSGDRPVRQKVRFVLNGERVELAHVDPNQTLLRYLRTLPKPGRQLAVAGFMADKAIDTMLAQLAPDFDRWHLGDLSGERAMSTDALSARLTALNATVEITDGSIAEALQAALKASQSGDRIVVFGSFVTVAETLCDHL